MRHAHRLTHRLTHGKTPGKKTIEDSSPGRFFPVKISMLPPPPSHSPVMDVVVVTIFRSMSHACQTEGPCVRARVEHFVHSCNILLLHSILFRTLYDSLFKCWRRYTRRLNSISHSRVIDTFVSSLHLFRLIFEVLNFLRLFVAMKHFCFRSTLGLKQLCDCSPAHGNGTVVTGDDWFITRINYSSQDQNSSSKMTFCGRLC